MECWNVGVQHSFTRQTGKPCSFLDKVRHGEDTAPYIGKLFNLHPIELA